jgi:serine/threonine protein kinase
MQRLLHYEISEKLGDGKNGETYLAIDTGLERVVAIKTLSPEVGRGKPWQELFLTRLEPLATFDDRRLPRVYSLETDGEIQFVVREYVDGRTFADIASHKPPEYPAFLGYALSAAIALKLLHDRDLCHGNLNSGNFIVDSSEQVRLLDYHLDLTDPNPFRAPEVSIESGPSMQGDLYALGVALYHLETGHLPTDNDEEGFRAISSLAQLLISRLMSADPAERFTDIDSVILTLREMISFGRQRFEPELGIGKRWRLTPRQYMLLSVLAILLVILWLIVTADPS